MSDDSFSSSENDDAPESPPDPLRLDPPTFELPADLEDGDYELWTVRLPISVEVEEMDGLEIRMSGKSRNNDDAKRIMGRFTQDGKEYGLSMGSSIENENFRLLVPNEEDEDSQLLVPISTPFARHINVASMDSLQEVPDTRLAPRLEVAPKPVDPVRRAYAPVPQVQSMKRRWMPAGAKAQPQQQHEETDSKKQPSNQNTGEVASPKKKKRKKEKSSPSKVNGSHPATVKAEKTVPEEKKEATETPQAVAHQKTKTEKDSPKRVNGSRAAPAAADATVPEEKEALETPQAARLNGKHKSSKKAKHEKSSSSKKKTPKSSSKKAKKEKKAKKAKKSL